MKPLAAIAGTTVLTLGLGAAAPAQCPGDLSGDGFVNVADMLVVVSAWGPCAGCAADLAPAMAPNGVVNVSDLLALINRWGACVAIARDAFVAETVSPPVQAQFGDYAASPALVVHESYIDANGDGMFDGFYALQAFFDAHVPPGYSGPICLDWEGAMGLLKLPPGAPLHTLAVQQYVAALQVARALRPAAQIGFYAIPMPRYYDRNAQWIEETAALEPILAQSTALFPSVYDYYPDAHTPGILPEHEAAYVRDNVQMALLFAAGKPVHPFVWPRYHSSNALWGFHSIPASEFIAHTATIFTAAYAGDRADGMIWWGADHYWNSIAEQNFPPGHPDYALCAVLNGVFNQETLPGETRAEYFDRLHSHHLQTVSWVVANAP